MLLGRLSFCSYVPWLQHFDICAPIQTAHVIHEVQHQSFLHDLHVHELCISFTRLMMLVQHFIIKWIMILLLYLPGHQ